MADPAVHREAAKHSHRCRSDHRIADSRSGVIRDRWRSRRRSLLAQAPEETRRDATPTGSSGPRRVASKAPYRAPATQPPTRTGARNSNLPTVAT
jgi:hypothetical protein